ncbi:MAG: aldehyde dehydrogenase family protein [Opitutales bacterium]
MLPPTALYLNGQWVESNQTLTVENPADQSNLADISVATDEHIAAAYRAAGEAQPAWGRRPARERGLILRRWADLLEADQERLAEIITREEGKPLAESEGEIALGLDWLRYYAEFDRRIEGDILPADRMDEQIWILRQPVGVVLAIIPWNYPFGVALRKIAPALIAGNALVLKPHEQTPLSALAIAEHAAEAGVPAGILSVLNGPGETVGAALARHPLPGLITFTGSVETGRTLAGVAAANLTRISLEMGGKAPFIVDADSDLDRAVEAAAFARYLNCGQVCICNERTFVHESVYTPFVEKLAAAADRLVVGDPLDRKTQMGPKVSRPELEKVERYVETARQAGATVITGGGRPTGGVFDRGHWYQPTVLADVRPDMTVMQEEIFGPVLPVMPYRDFDEVLTWANATPYGLSAYLFTRDLGKVMRAVQDLALGEVYLNRGPGESVHGFHTGWKQSGIGGDDGKYGLESYFRKKTVYLKAPE